MTKSSTVDEYIAIFLPSTQKVLQSIRKAIQAAAPEAQEGISYQMPTYKQNGVLCHYAGYEHHIGFYPTPAAIIHFKEEISRYNSALMNPCHSTWSSAWWNSI